MSMDKASKIPNNSPDIPGNGKSPLQFYRASYYTTQVIEEQLQQICIKLQAADRSEAIRMLILMFANSEVDVVLQLKKRAYNKKTA